MAGRYEPAETVGIDFDHVTGMVAPLSAHRLGRFQVADAAQTTAAQDPADRGRRYSGLADHLLAGEAFAEQGNDPLLDRCEGRSSQPVQSRRAICQPRRALNFKRSTRLPTIVGSTREAAAEALRGRPCSPLRAPPPAGYFHPRSFCPPGGVSEVCDSSFLGLDRIDNVLRVQIEAAVWRHKCGEKTTYRRSWALILSSAAIRLQNMTLLSLTIY